MRYTQPPPLRFVRARVVAESFQRDSYEKICTLVVDNQFAFVINDQAYAGTFRDRAVNVFVGFNATTLGALGMVSSHYGFLLMIDRVSFLTAGCIIPAKPLRKSILKFEKCAAKLGEFQISIVKYGELQLQRMMNYV